MIADASSSLNEAAEPLQEIVAKQLGRYQYKTVSLADETLFSLSLGKRLLKKDFIEDKGDIPVYSANVFDPFVYTDESNIASFEYDYVLWGIDGIFSFNVMKKGSRFATTDHCGTIKVLNSSIDPYYLAYIWRKQGISMALIED